MLENSPHVLEVGWLVGVDDRVFEEEVARVLLGPALPLLARNPGLLKRTQGLRLRSHRLLRKQKALARDGEGRVEELPVRHLEVFDGVVVGVEPLQLILLVEVIQKAEGLLAL